MEQVFRKVLRSSVSNGTIEEKTCGTWQQANIAWLGRSAANTLQMKGRLESLVPTYVFTEMKLLGLVISKTELGRQILGIYKSRTDSVGMRKRPHSFISWNT
jgi:hypothetical protein